jgi:glycosyltransferase involved in cell wall biosynthesis|tara:strand:+ start:971 stop:1753 length:783 start_codon:yes stop_codon:yes gene_type:complete
MKISVVCPTYNSAKFIENTLTSILNQTETPHELIISDDGSEDNTIQFINNFLSSSHQKISYKILQNKHKGPGATRNAGILDSTGDWIAFIDSDDIWYPEKISHVKNLINRNKDINFICHNEMLVNKNNRKSIMRYSKKFNVNKPLFDQLYISNLFSTSAVVCKKKLLINSGLFDETLMSAQDYELWLRLAPNVNVLFDENILGEYIVRDGNITSSGLFKRFKNELKIAKKYSKHFKLQKFFKRVVVLLLSYCKQFVQKWI